MSKILRIDMKTLKVHIEDISKEDRLLAGTALISKIMNAEVDPLCDPLGRKNKLIYTSGLLAGTSVPCSGRVSIGSKSPLTKGIKEANSGGDLGHYMARSGLKAIVIENQPEDSKDFYVIKIDKDGATFYPADFCQGEGVYKTAEKIHEKFGKECQISIIGPAGENRMLAAGIANTDREGSPTRFSGRGGLGAVMGSKGVKALVFDKPKDQGIKVANEDSFKKSRDKFVNAILSNPALGKGGSYPVFGTAANVHFMNELHGLPTRNFNEGTFEGASKIDGKTLYDRIIERKGHGRTTHACMSGCIIQCSNVYPDKNGLTLVSPLEYETIGLMGSNLGIDELDEIAELNYLCNDLGLDTLDIGGALGVAMEEGYLSFGDAQGAKRILEEIKKGSIIGRVFGNGTQVTGVVLGAKHIPTVRNQCMPAYEPRAIKGFGVTYITNPMGADHTRGCTHKMQLDHQDPHVQAEASYQVQLGFGVPDITGFCLFAASAMGADKEIVLDMINSVYDTQLTKEDLFQMVKESLNREIEFNKKAGLPAIERLPEYMYYEENKTTRTVFDVEEEEINKIFLKGF